MLQSRYIMMRLSVCVSTYGIFIYFINHHVFYFVSICVISSHFWYFGNILEFLELYELWEFWGNALVRVSVSVHVHTTLSWDQLIFEFFKIVLSTLATLEFFAFFKGQGCMVKKCDYLVGNSKK